MMGEIKDIPKHWQVKKLGDVCKILAGYGFPKNFKVQLQENFPFTRLGIFQRM